MSPSCHCHPPVRSSTQPRTSGSICDRPISPTVCSRPTPTSSTPAKTPGENFSPKPGASPRSRLATGPSSVSSSEGWYYLLVFCWRARKHGCHTFRIDVEGQEYQRLVAWVSPLVHESVRFIDQGTWSSCFRLTVDRVGPGAGDDKV